jgi:uncharacterized protein YjbJ (UPF0337 family)
LPGEFLALLELNKLIDASGTCYDQRIFEPRSTGRSIQINASEPQFPLHLLHKTTTALSVFPQKFPFFAALGMTTNRATAPRTRASKPTVAAFIGRSTGGEKYAVDDFRNSAGFVVPGTGEFVHAWRLHPPSAPDCSSGSVDPADSGPQSCLKTHAAPRLKQRRIAHTRFNLETHGGELMNKDKVKGTIDDAVGRATRQVGEWTSETDKQVKGAAQQVKGKVEKISGEVKDAVNKAANQPATPAEGSVDVHDEEHTPIVRH